MSNCAQVTQGGDLIAEGKISVVHQKEAPKPTADAAEKEDAPEVPAAEETPQAETDADAEAEPTEVLQYQQAGSPSPFANFSSHQSMAGESFSPVITTSLIAPFSNYCR